MANKENLDQLTDYIDKLKKLTENIYEREIYPVSFFSQAFDVTHKIQESLHLIETAQIELFEKQMKEHQAQIRNIQCIEKKYEPVKTTSSIDEKLLKSSSFDNSTQATLLKEDHRITEKETMIENKNAETEYTPPIINERLPEASSFDDSTQVILSKTDHHVTEKETITENKKTETTQIFPSIEDQSLKESPLADNPEIIPSETDLNIANQEVALTKKSETQLPIFEKKPQTVANSLDKKFEKKTLSDLKKAFTLNDRFRFCRELFSSNENLMNQTFSELNNIESYSDSIAYIKEHFDWNLEEEVAIEFISMIEKRFN